MESGDVTAQSTNLSNTTNTSSDANITYNSIGREKYNSKMQTAFIPLMVIIGLESLIGVIGNTMVFYVFYTRYKKCNFKYFALFLCSIDIAGCIFSMPLDIALRYYYFDVPGSVFCKIKFFSLLSVILAETFTLLIISVDRYRKICQPLSWQISTKTAIRLCVCAIIVAVIGSCLITSIITGRHYEEVHYKNMTVITEQCGSDEIYKNTAISGIFIIAEYMVIVSILVVMIVLYIIVARQLYRTKASADPNKNTDRKETAFIKTNVAPARRKSIIAITLTVIFIITISLHAVFTFLISSNALPEPSFDEWAIYTFLYTTYMVNYFINPIIYGWLDQQFSKFLRDLKNKLCWKRDNFSFPNDENNCGSKRQMDKSSDLLYDRCGETGQHGSGNTTVTH